MANCAPHFYQPPHVNVEKLSIDSANAKGPVSFKGQVDKASISLALIPLLSGHVVVSDVTLIKPVIDLKEQKTKGTATKKSTSNVDVKTQGDDVSADTPAVSVESVSIYNAKISYTPLKGELMDVEIPELNLQADDLMGTI